MSKRDTLIAASTVLAAAGVVGILALLGVFRAAHPAKAFQQTSFAFDSRYEDERGEEIARSEVMAREEKAQAKQEADETPEEEEHHGLGGEDGIKSATCRVIPPPPDATRMVCKLSVENEEKYERSPTTREVIVWTAEVLLNPRTGELTAHVARLSA
jgi:hypothetical protein